MAPKLEEQMVQQEQQLALLAAIVFAGRESFDLSRPPAWDMEAKRCVEIAALIQKAAGQHVAGE